jgi:two-component system OmpR family response regulator
MNTFRIALTNIRFPATPEESVALAEQAIAQASIERAGHASAELECGPLRLDTRSSRVTRDGVPVKLTAQEYRLLAYLLHHRGRVVSRTELTEHLYDQDFDRDSNTIEVFIGRLRKKIGAELIQTVRGLGYQLTTPGARAKGREAPP